MCLQRATAGAADEIHDAGEEAQDRDAFPAREWFGVISFQSNVNVVDVPWANIAVSPFTKELPRSSPWSYNSRVFRQSSMKRSRVYE